MNAGAPAPAWTPPDDPLGAFCRDNHAALAGAQAGPLRGLRFAVKDVYDIAGHRTGYGQPDWLRTHLPATETADAVRRLLDAGASMIGRTLSDELAYSLSGENIHYGTPINPRAPGRIPGGSSNGSASAVAGGLVDFALGTDCGGSVRLPASYCGILGIRPSHGRVSLAGVIPFAPSFDVAGWFARDAMLFERIGAVLLQGADTGTALRRLLWARDAFDLAEPATREALASPVARIRECFAAFEQVQVSDTGLANWFEVFRTIQAFEVWSNHGAWISRVHPQLGPGVRERIEWAATVTAAQAAAARRERERIVERLRALIAPGDVLCLPTSPRGAPKRDTPAGTLETTFRQQAMNLLCIAGLGGLPQVSLPMAEVDGLPVGLSLVGARGSDEMLLALAVRLADALRIEHAGPPEHG